MSDKVQRYALIVAGGTGVRMNARLPKQFMDLNGLPVLMHTIRAFAVVDDVKIIVVLPQAQIELWKALCEEKHFEIAHETIAGGDTRFHSVRNGLEKVGEGLVAIHDGVRPLVTKDLIEFSYEAALKKGNAVTAVKLKDSIREVLLTGGTRNVNRNNYYLIQTPQTFVSAIIRKAYAEATHYNFTDDAGVVEEAGERINLIEGSYENIKITTPGDIAVAEALMKLRQA